VPINSQALVAVDKRIEPDALLRHVRPFEAANGPTANIQNVLSAVPRGLEIEKARVKVFKMVVRESVSLA
jgi:hypothetical protein